MSADAITTPNRLAAELARHAREIRAQAAASLRREQSRPGPLTELSRALATEAPDAFADVYAQSVAYGLLAARWFSRDQALEFRRTNIRARVPSADARLLELLERLVDGPFEPALADRLDALARVLAETPIAELFRAQPDPAIHFYQQFLAAYDPRLRRARGVYYTPTEVAEYVVRSVDSGLRERFGLRLGLADSTTWAELVARRELALPPGARGDRPFVRILDPAAGTGTFLVHVIAVVHETMLAEYARAGLDAAATERAWTDYVRAQLLPRLHGFELMPAPYVVAQLRIGLALEQTGFVFGPNDRLGLTLTDALDRQASLERGFSVVIGNPPYQRGPGRRDEFVEQLVAPFKHPVRDERNLQPLSDDYIAFVGLATHHVEREGAGVLALVVNGTCLAGRLHRGLRGHLRSSYDFVALCDLHGSQKVALREELDDETDENVFDIQQGVAIVHAERHLLLAARGAIRHAASLGLFAKGGVAETCSTSSTAAFRLLALDENSGARRRVGLHHGLLERADATLVHVDLVGSRASKLAWLRTRARDQPLARHSTIAPTPPLHLFSSASPAPAEYAEFVPLTRLFEFFSVSGKPGKDELLVCFSPDEVIAKLEARRDELARGCVAQPTEAERKLALRPRARGFDPANIRRYAYRPGDTRWVYYDPEIWTRPVTALADRLDGAPVLLTTKIVKDSSFAHVWITRELADVIGLSATSSVNCYSFPLTGNFDASALGLDVDPARGLDYVYAILHSPSYRRRYAPALRHEFARIPIPCSRDGFEALARLGAELRELHLFDRVIELDPEIASFVDGGDRVVTRVGEVRRGLAEPVAGFGRLRINERSWFERVPESAWALRVGGYQLLHKWLVDRKKARRTLSDADLLHYRRLVGLCARTLELMATIDERIITLGGWPGFCRRPRQSR